MPVIMSRVNLCPSRSFQGVTLSPTIRMSLPAPTTRPFSECSSPRTTNLPHVNRSIGPFLNRVIGWSSFVSKLHHLSNILAPTSCQEARELHQLQIERVGALPAGQLVVQLCWASLKPARLSPSTSS